MAIGEGSSMFDEERLTQAVLDGDRDTVRTLVSAALEAGMDAVKVLTTGLLPAMEIVGQRFGAKQIYIVEVLLSARAMHAGLALIRPALTASQAELAARPVVVLGTVKGDLHDIGKNLVAMMLEAGGFTVVDLGTNVSAERFVAAVKEHHASVIGLSALLTTTMREMRQTIEAVRRASVTDGVKIVIGGAPVTQEFADTIGADAYAPDAPTAVGAVRGLLAR
jgi:5-methyltetrahydrofolate--homocysteine methyltransferase